MKRAWLGVFIVAFILLAGTAEASHWEKMSGSDGAFPLFPDGRFYKVQSLDKNTFVALGNRMESLSDFNFRSVFRSDDGGVTVAPIYDAAEIVDGFLCKSLIQVNDLHFFDAEHGLIFGGWGTAACGLFTSSTNYIASTSDGGRTWTPLPLVPEMENSLISGATFSDRLTGYAAGISKNLWKTTDGGATWTRIPSAYTDEDGIEYVSLSSPNSMDVYAAGEWYPYDTWADDDWSGGKDEDWGEKDYADLNAESGALVHSADGGQTWDYLLSDNELEWPYQYSVGFHKVQFLGLKGWLLAVNAVSFLVDLMTTDDGGATWESAVLPLSNAGMPGSGYVIADFQMLNNGEGWAVGYTYRGDSVIIKTTNYGDTWELDDYAEYGPLLSVSLLNGRSGFATGSRETVVRFDAPNRPPVANAGYDHSVYVNTTAELDGRGSYDPDGEPITYQWTQLGGPEIVITGPTSAVASFFPSVLGLYTFGLIVSDGELTSQLASVRIRAVPPGTDLDDDAGDDGDDASDDAWDDDWGDDDHDMAADDSDASDEFSTISPDDEDTSSGCGC